MLTGPLPESIGQWVAIETFSVYENDLNGTIPESIGQWMNIGSAKFYDNTFTGPISDNICSIENAIVTVDAGNNCSCCVLNL